MLAFALPSPFPAIINGILIAIFALTLFHWFYSKTIKLNNGKPGLITKLLLLLFFFFIVGALTSENLKDGFSSLFTRVSLLALPLFFGSNFTFDHRQIRNILLSFVFASFCISILCLINNLLTNYHDNIEFAYYNSWLFSGENLTRKYGFHPAYFSMYISFCISILLSMLKNESRRYKKLIIVLLLLYFVLFMAGLASRMGFIALTVIMLLSLILLLKVPNYVKLSIVLSIVFIQLFLIFNFPTLKEKFIGLFNYNLDENSYKHRADVRLTIWQSCLEIIKENPLLGVGLGDVEQKLLDKYKRFNYTEGLDRRYNAHNQFLQTTVEVGVLGLATLLFVMGVSISFAITKKNFVSLCFLSIALLFFLSESILVRQKGIVFFSFFMPLLNVVAFKDKGIEKS